jgi:multidrug efflux pump
MGVAVFSGMIGVTAFGIFFTRMFYVLPRALAGNRPVTQHRETSVEHIVGGHVD